MRSQTGKPDTLLPLLIDLGLAAEALWHVDRTAFDWEMEAESRLMHGAIAAEGSAREINEAQELPGVLAEIVDDLRPALEGRRIWRTQGVVEVRIRPHGADIDLAGFHQRTGTSTRVVFECVPPGVQSLLVTLVGHEPYEERVHVEPGGLTTIDVRLQPAALTPPPRIRAQTWIAGAALATGAVVTLVYGLTQAAGRNVACLPLGGTCEEIGFLALASPASGSPPSDPGSGPLTLPLASAFAAAAFGLVVSDALLPTDTWLDDWLPWAVGGALGVAAYAFGAALNPHGNPR